MSLTISAFSYGPTCSGRKKTTGKASTNELRFELITGRPPEAA